MSPLDGVAPAAKVPNTCVYLAKPRVAMNSRKTLNYETSGFHSAELGLFATSLRRLRDIKLSEAALNCVNWIHTHTQVNRAGFIKRGDPITTEFQNYHLNAWQLGPFCSVRLLTYLSFDPHAWIPQILSQANALSKRRGFQLFQQSYKSLQLWVAYVVCFENCDEIELDITTTAVSAQSSTRRTSGGGGIGDAADFLSNEEETNIS